MTAVPEDVQGFATEADEWAHLVADIRIAELAEMEQDGLGELLLDQADKREVVQEATVTEKVAPLTLSP